MGVLYKVSAKTGTYTTKDGQEKTRYQEIGVVIQGKTGLMLKVESLPVGWDGWAYLNEPKPPADSAY